MGEGANIGTSRGDSTATPKGGGVNDAYPILVDTPLSI